MTDTAPAAAPAVAPAPKTQVLPPGHVKVRVMKRGDRRIFTGETCERDEEKFPTFRQNDETTMPRSTAEKYEDDGMVEILP